METQKIEVRLNVCWECGLPRIVGGKNGRLPYNLYKEAEMGLTDIYKTRIKDLLEAKHIENDKFLYKVVSSKYDGC